MADLPPCLICEHLLTNPSQPFKVSHTPRSARPALLCTTLCAEQPEALTEVSLSDWRAVLADGDWEETGGLPTPPALDHATIEEMPWRGASLPLQGISRKHLLDATFQSNTLFLLCDAPDQGKLLRRFTLSSDASSLDELPTLRLDTLIEEDTFWRYLEDERGGGDGKRDCGPCSIHVSACTRYLCVTQSAGSFAVLLDLSAPRLVRELNREDYHVDVSEFPAAFAVVDEEVILVAGSDWNRVDAYRAHDGELLTARELSPGEDGERPEHYLDYFYGELTTSPASRWAISSGWCWHPVGVVRAWRLDTWLKENPFESEDGPTRRTPDPLVDDLWDRALIFLDDDRLLVWGIFHDSFLHAPGLMVYDLSRDAVLDIIPLEGVQCCGLGHVEGDALILDQAGDVWRVNLATHRVEARHQGLGAFRLLSHGVTLCTWRGGDQLELALLGPLP